MTFLLTGGGELKAVEQNESLLQNVINYRQVGNAWQYRRPVQINRARHSRAYEAGFECAGMT